MCLTDKSTKHINGIVEYYISRLQDFDNLVSHVKDDFMRNQDFYNLIHSVKFRTKDPDHFRRKLERIAKENKANNRVFKITKENVFNQVKDLAGVRFLHLYTEQMKQIHPMIIAILEHYKYKQVCKPVAYIWDIETQQIFKSLDIRTVLQESMYTSVHYVIQPYYSKDRCEIQVRTLMEEVWGEVSHKINYPQKTKSEACQEQLKVLARVTSGCKRLVDSIIVSHREYETFLKNTDRAR